MHTAALSFLLALAAPPVAADTVVVCPAEWRETLRPWLDHRAEQGHSFAFVSNRLSAEKIRAAIREEARSGKLKAVLLVGDAIPQGSTDEELRARSLPTHFAKARVNVRFGSEPEIATDNWYVDLDDDEVPDLTIGRLTADSAAELARMIEKILAYERSAEFGPWRQRINLVAGVGGFGSLIDSTIELAARRFITEGIPAAYATTMTYGSWRSPYCPDPRQFHATTLERFNEGCLFWVYIGHGQKTFLDRVHVPGSAHHILASADAPKLKCRQGSPIAVFLACYTGAFDQEEDCLAEEMLRAEGGPVAVFSGSRVTMPYAMSVMGTEMLDVYFRNRPATLGEVLLAAKRRMAADSKAEGQITNRRVIDGLASLLSPHDRLDLERLEHLQLFNLLGDPLLRLAHPRPMTLLAAEETTAGETLVVTGECPLPGRCTIELVCRRDLLRFSLPARDQFDHSPEGLARLSETYERANDQLWSRRTINLEAGKFRAEIEVPAECAGICHVRAFVEGRDGAALGAADLYVKRKAQGSTSSQSRKQP